MVILGVADGADASAALTIDGQLVAVESQERLDRMPRSRTFPWAAIESVLGDAGLRAEHVDLVAVAGRFTPPFFLRRHPGLYRLVRDPFSPGRDLGVFYQAMLRQSGLGALEADRAADWIQDQLATRGLRPQRTVLVDIHRALSAVAYRCQPDDDVLAFTLHPMGDGVSVGVHRGMTGQVDRLWTQRGFSALHVHLKRCATAIGLDPETQMHLLGAVAGRGEADGGLVELLDAQLRADGPRLSRRSYPFPSTRSEPLYAALADATPEVAAASVLENLRRAVCGVVRYHLGRDTLRDVVLSGEVFDNPRLVAAVAELDEVDTVFAEPFGGHRALAVGASAWVAGLSPHRMAGPGLGRDFGAAQCERAIHMAGAEAIKPGDGAEAVAGLLAAGHPVARFHGRAGFGPWALGTRTVLVRADRPDVLIEARRALGRSPLEEPGCAWLPVPGDGEVRHAGKLDEVLRFGNVAVQVDGAFAARYPAVVAPDGRVLMQRVDAGDDPGLHRILAALHRRTGCAAVACLPLSEGGEPIVAFPGDALRVWRRTDLAALALGPYLLQRDLPGGDR